MRDVKINIDDLKHFFVRKIEKVSSLQSVFWE